MKKITHYISFVISILLLINIFKIMNLGIKQLSEFGYGYLVGKIILFLVFVVVFYRKQNIKSWLFLKVKLTIINCCQIPWKSSINLIYYDPKKNKPKEGVFIWGILGVLTIKPLVYPKWKSSPKEGS